MEDKIGKRLLESRISNLLPLIKGKLLDIGCGTNELSSRYGEGLGVDVYDWGSVDLIVENTAELPFEDKSFDTITIVAALNHIPNRAEVLTESNRLLRDDGLLIVTMIPPMISKMWHRIREPWDVDQHERGMVEGEVFGLTNNQMISLLNNAGFSLALKKKFMLGINTIYSCKKSN
jgi:SAM-dependent methyltransferase